MKKRKKFSKCFCLLESTKVSNVSSAEIEKCESFGKHPKFFQGKATCLESRKIISMAIQQQIPFTCDIINYKKDRRTYTCHIDGYPIFDKDGKLVNFVAIENAA